MGCCSLTPCIQSIEISRRSRKSLVFLNWQSYGFISDIGILEWGSYGLIANPGIFKWGSYGLGSCSELAARSPHIRRASKIPLFLPHLLTYIPPLPDLISYIKSCSLTYWYFKRECWRDSSVLTRTPSSPTSLTTHFLQIRTLVQKQPTLCFLLTTHVMFSSRALHQISQKYGFALSSDDDGKN